MGDAPADFIAAQLAGIVALRLRVSRVEAKAKLSQNRAPADVDSVAREFERRGNQALAQAMRRRD
jgi:transcriptional regulator